MSVLWKGCTTRGAVIGGFLGLLSSVLLTVVSPSVWEATLGNPKGSALFPYTSPALFSMTIAFVGIWPADQLVDVIIAQYLFKTIWEAVMYPATAAVVRFLKRVEGVDFYDRGTNFNPFSIKV